MTDDLRAAGHEALADALLAANARLAGSGLPRPILAQLQRQYIAICDAAKMPGASPASCWRRLDNVLTALDNALACERDQPPR